MTAATAERVDVQSILTPHASFPAPTVRTHSGVSMVDEHGMTALIRVAEIMASGRATVPRHLQNNVADCLAIVMQAQRWGMDPFVVAKKTYVVDGNLSYEAQLVAAVINTSSLINGRLSYEWFGKWENIVGRFKQVESKTKKDDYGNPKKYMVPDWRLEDERGLGVRVTGQIRSESKPRELEILMTQARTRNSTLWAEDPKQQIAYLATNRWGRLHTPELILGVYTPDELAMSTSVFMGAADVVEPERAAAPQSLKDAAHAAAGKGRDAFGVYWKELLPAQRSLLAEELDALAKVANEADKNRTVDNGAAPAQPAATSAAAPAAQATDATAKPARTRPPAPPPKPTAAPAAQAPATTGAPVFTAEAVKKRLADASDLDALYIAADLINAVADEGARAALEAFFDERKAAFEQ